MLFEKFFPTLSNNLFVLFNNWLNHWNLMFLETMIINHLNRIYIILCITSVFYYMNVHWFMCVRVELEVISIFVQCAWHINPLSSFNATYYTISAWPWWTKQGEAGRRGLPNCLWRVNMIKFMPWKVTEPQGIQGDGHRRYHLKSMTKCWIRLNAGWIPLRNWSGPTGKAWPENWK